MTDESDAGEEREEKRLLEENRALAQRYLELENNCRKQVEKLRSANAMLSRGEAHMRILLENASIGFALLDLNMRVVTANKTLSELLGYDPNELTGENFHNFVYVGKLPAFTRLIGHSDTPSRPNDTIDLVAKDGGLRPCRLAASDWRDDDGAIRGTFILAFNVDEEIRASTRLREVETVMAEAQKARSLFLDVVSRELRTPAGSIMGMASMLMETELTERQAELVGVIHSSASSLARLVDDIVDVARVDTGDLRLDYAPLRPRELAEGIAGMFGVRAEEKGLELRVHVSGAIPERIIGDAGRLRRVLAHLLDNAIKFTEHGHVSLSVDPLGDTIRFMVSDTGGGIVAEPGVDIFEDRHGGDTPSSRRHGGIGVGLAIARRLVGLMGGRIGYETEPGRGAEFHFTIPLILPTDAAGDGEMAPPAEAIRLAPMSILLADANPLGRRVVKAYLQFDGHALTLVGNGLEAAEQCKTGHFDLAILDIHLPKLDGLQTLRLIRDNERATGRARVPVLLLATPAHLREPEYYRGQGADGIVKKPVHPVDLMEAVSRATGAKPLAVAREKAPNEYAAEASGSSIRRIDGSQLVNLRQVMPEEQFIGVLRFFMEDAVPGLLDIQRLAGQEEPDMQRIAFACSKTRGLAGYLGFFALAELLKRIEHASRTGADPAHLREMTDELPMVTDDSLEELKRILPDAFATISEMTGPIEEESE